MRYSDSTQINIPKPVKYANSDSSSFNSDEAMSDEDLSPQFITPSTNSNYDPTSSSSNDHSSIKLCDYSPFKEIIITPQTDIPVDRSRHPSQNQSNPFPPLLTELLKLIIICDINQNYIIVFPYHPQTSSTNHSRH